MSNPKVFINPKSGSIRVTGTVEFVDAAGNLMHTVENPKFCGCGYSQEKPFCDGSHKKISQPATALEKARVSAQAIEPFNPPSEIAHQVRERLVAMQIDGGDQIVGLKIGGALESVENQSGIMIYGFLTESMRVDEEFKSASYIYPRAEAEVVFKLSHDISAPITIDEVLNFVSEVAVGMEIFDYRYGQAQIYSSDAIADNAGAAGFAVGEWVPAKQDVFKGLKTSVLCNTDVVESADLSVIRGNPWEAVVQLSQLAATNKLVLKKDWIIFSGSATKGVPLISGNSYSVDTPGLGSVEISVL